MKKILKVILSIIGVFTVGSFGYLGYCKLVDKQEYGETIRKSADSIDGWLHGRRDW